MRTGCAERAERVQQSATRQYRNVLSDQKGEHPAGDGKAGRERELRSEKQAERTRQEIRTGLAILKEQARRLRDKMRASGEFETEIGALDAWLLIIFNTKIMDESNDEFRAFLVAYFACCFTSFQLHSCCCT